MLKPRLNDSDPCSTFVAQLQVCICNLARATVGVKKSDRLKVEDLLHKAGFEMVNRKVMYSIAMECWRVLSLRDVPDGPLNPLGAILFTNSSRSLHTRWANSDCLSPPPPQVPNGHVHVVGLHPLECLPPSGQHPPCPPPRRPLSCWPRMPPFNFNFNLKMTSDR